MTIRRLTAALAALTMLIAACGDDDARQLPPDDDTVAGAAGTCPEGTPDCDDTLFPDGEPNDGPTPSEPGDPMPGEDPLTVGEALAAGEGELLMIRGFYVDTGNGPMLCEALAESFPPQCGGASIPMDDISAVDPESIQTEQTTSWSDDPVFVLGEIVDGELVASPFAA